MGIKKKSYRPRKRHIIAKQSAASRIKQLFVTICGRKFNLVGEYVNFLKKLMTKEELKQIARQIYLKSEKWNEIRRYKITASQTKRIYSWTQKTPYIFDSLSRKIYGNKMSRGEKIEKLAIDLVQQKGIDVWYKGKPWIHRNFPWISATTDGVIVKDKKILFVIEVKSYLSDNSFRKAFSANLDNYELKKSSSEYFQIQMLAEVVNVTHVLFIFEYKLKLHVKVVKRDLDFLYRIFERLKQFYFKFMIPYHIINNDSTDREDPIVKTRYISDVTYSRLMNILEKNEQLIHDQSDVSILSCGGFDPPSIINSTYFEMFTDVKILRKIRRMDLGKVKLTEEKINSIQPNNSAK